MANVQKILKGDGIIWGVMIVLAVVGGLEVYSTTAAISYKFQGGNTFVYPLTHVMYLMIGFVCMFVFSLIPYKFYVKHANWLMYTALILLFLTLFSGNSTNDARRWLTIPGLGISVQTSDFAKLILVLYLAKMLALAQVETENQIKYFWYCLGAIGGVCVLVLPSNFSTAALIAVSSFVMLILGKFPRKWRWRLIGGAVLLFVLLVLFTKAANIHTRFDTWVARIETYFSGGGALSSDFQSEQAIVAIGLGGWTGESIGGGVQNTSLPHPYSDFIFASIAHEIGIVGVLGVIALYTILFYRCVMVVKQAKTLFPALLVMGLTMNIMLQTLANMLVAVGLIPVTGQPLPFVSMGGTSIMCTGIAIGVILNISRYSGEKETVEEIEKDITQEEEIVDYPFMAG
ncbi:MAG: FtsW/RodA/SpoVE family cell cycle protein [Bacteroidales bacterium]|nr:FtsW/RodA/SpoVE family cell cycle protein [Bacteroidales bacterium]